MSCTTIWDGLDFSPCFRERYIANSPLVLAAFGAVITLIYSRKRNFKPINASDLVSPNGDNISRLEADVLMASVAETALPPVDRVVEAEERRPLPPKEADKIVNDFRRSTTKNSRRWDFVYRVVSVLGAVAWCSVQGAAVFWAKEDKRAVVFPVRPLTHNSADQADFCSRCVRRRSALSASSSSGRHHLQPHSVHPPLSQ